MIEPVTKKNPTGNRADGAHAVSDLLVRAAQEVVASQGWTGASSRKIAQRAELNPALINYYFRSKDLLLFAALEASAKRVGETLSACPAGVEAGVVEWLCHSVRALQSPSMETEMKVIVEATVHAPRDPKLLSFARGQLDHFRELLANMLRTEAQEGRLQVGEGEKGESELRYLASGLAALADGIAIQLALDPSIEVESILRRFVTRLLDSGPPPS